MSRRPPSLLLRGVKLHRHTLVGGFGSGLSIALFENHSSKGADSKLKEMSDDA
jgi:hypothetical protein